MRVGDTITIQRAGDVIPQVLSVDKSKRHKSSKKFIFPDKCLCGSLTKKEINISTKKKDAVRRCTKGYECDFIAKEKLKHIVSTDAFEIEGLGKKLIDSFWELKLIKTPADIFSLNYKKIEKLEGWGKLSIKNLQNAINKSKDIVLEVHLFYRYKTHRTRKRKNLGNFFKKPKNFLNCLIKKRNEILKSEDFDGITDTQIKSINDFFQTKQILKYPILNVISQY